MEFALPWAHLSETCRTKKGDDLSSQQAGKVHRAGIVADKEIAAGNGGHEFLEGEMGGLDDPLPGHSDDFLDLGILCPGSEDHHPGSQVVPQHPRQLVEMGPLPDRRP